MKKWFLKTILLLALIGTLLIMADEQIVADSVRTVWITPTGKKYHRENCRTIRDKKQEISLEEAEQRKYEPCKVCDP